MPAMYIKKGTAGTIDMGSHVMTGMRCRVIRKTPSGGLAIELLETRKAYREGQNVYIKQWEFKPDPES